MNKQKVAERDHEPTIVVRAYQLWEAAGRPPGRDEEFHFAAEEELRDVIERKCVPEDDERHSV